MKLVVVVKTVKDFGFVNDTVIVNLSTSSSNEEFSFEISNNKREIKRMSDKPDIMIGRGAHQEHHRIIEDVKIGNITITTNSKILVQGVTLDSVKIYGYK